MVDEFLDENADFTGHQRHPTANFAANKVGQQEAENFRTANFHNYLGRNTYQMDSEDEASSDAEPSQATSKLADEFLELPRDYYKPDTTLSPT